jgi:hypothetical protein
VEIGSARRRRRRRRTTTKIKPPPSFSTWRKFLKKNGGKGYTRAKLVRMYHKKYDKKGRIKKAIKVKNMIQKNTVQKAKEIDSSCLKTLIVDMPIFISESALLSVTS